jgi:glycosyltransferase involved in cell wall biosynthesis
MLEDFPLWSWSWNPWLMLIRAFQLIVVRSAQRVVVPSQYMAKIVAGWGVVEKNIVVIYNGVSVGDVGVRNTIRGVLHFEGKLLISVGRLVPWKGFDTLIKVAARLRKKFKDLRLFIVGSGPELERLEALAQSEGIADHVIFAGAVDRDALLRYIKASDVFALNTSYEGLSHLILETLAVGVPVVTTNVGGNPEVITDGVDGYMVNPNDMMALQSRITTLFEKSDVYQRIATAGLARAGEFTDARVIQQTAALLKSL